MKLNNEEDFYKLLTKLRTENRITVEENEAIGKYICGIFDALHGKYGIKEDDLC